MILLNESASLRKILISSDFDKEAKIGKG